MTWVRHKVNFNRAPGSGVIFSGRTDVILNVASAQHTSRVHVLKIGKNLGRGPADDLYHHVEAPAMAHGQDYLVDAQSRAGFHNVVEQRNQDGKALERVALCSNKARL